jgi:hypothetical protein
VGGLALRYLVGALPSGVPQHVGTTDVDLVIGLALGDDAPETYRTLQNNLVRSGFTRDAPSFRWQRDVGSKATDTGSMLRNTEHCARGHRLVRRCSEKSRSPSSAEFVFSVELRYAGIREIGLFR